MPKLRITGPLWRKPLVTSGFPQRRQVCGMCVCVALFTLSLLCPIECFCFEDCVITGLRLYSFKIPVQYISKQRWKRNVIVGSDNDIQVKTMVYTTNSSNLWMSQIKYLRKDYILRVYDNTATQKPQLWCGILSSQSTCMWKVIIQCIHLIWFVSWRSVYSQFLCRLDFEHFTHNFVRCHSEINSLHQHNSKYIYYH